MNISQQFYKDIFDSLATEYDKEEVSVMLDKASFTETEDSVVVIYDNGIKDVFIKTVKVKLIHSKDIGKV